MTTALWTAALLCVTLQAPGEPNDRQGAEAQSQPVDVKAILTKAEEAMEAVHGVRFTAQFTPDQVMSTLLPSIEGEAAYVAAEGADSPTDVRIECTITMPGADPRELVMGAYGIKVQDGQTTGTFYAIDPASKTVHTSGDFQVVGSLARHAMRWLPIMEFIGPDPLKDELNAEKLEYRGQATVGTEPCHRIFVDYAKAPERSEWYFSANDYLPRRRDHTVVFPDGKTGQYSHIIFDITPNPDWPKDYFKLQVPEGFKTTADPGPDA